MSKHEDRAREFLRANGALCGKLVEAVCRKDRARGEPCLCFDKVSALAALFGDVAAGEAEACAQTLEADRTPEHGVEWGLTPDIEQARQRARNDTLAEQAKRLRFRRNAYMATLPARADVQSAQV